MNFQDPDKERFTEKARRYSSARYSLAIIDIIYLLLLLFLFLAFDLSKILSRELSGLAANNYLVVPLYILIIYIVYYALGFPLNIYRSLILERKFSLSRQKLKDWFKDQIKAGIVSYIITLILIAGFYYIVEHYTRAWWLVVSVFWIFFSLILAKLTPVIIIPIFFKYRELSDALLKERIVNLAKRMQIKILDVFEIDFSRKTLKANAAFVGVGGSKRVILADTLKDKYSFDEIEVIIAHEFAHYKLRHLLKLILVNSIAAMLSFYFIYKTSDYFLRLLGLSSLLDIASFPIILIYLIIFGIITQPVGNYISRRLERNADLLALKVTGLKDAFVSMMEKLARQNLADRNPSFLIKVIFFDHPPVDERIALVESSPKRRPVS